MFPHLRTRYVVAHAALRWVAAGLTGRPARAVQWQLGPQGKPALADSGLQLNLSHSGDWAMIAAHERDPVGVDLEQIHPARATPSMFGSITSDAERAALQRLPSREREVAFFRIWVRKEAVLKVLGVGLSRSLSSVDVPVGVVASHDAVGLRPPLAADRTLVLWDLPAPLGYLAAVVIEQPRDEPPRRPDAVQTIELPELLGAVQG
ncbi:MAG: 4'-phosphopantetheinyl transferase superfamily protein [Nannocystaceae bacterium]